MPLTRGGASPTIASSELPDTIYIFDSMYILQKLFVRYPRSPWRCTLLYTVSGLTFRFSQTRLSGEEPQKRTQDTVGGIPTLECVVPVSVPSHAVPTLWYRTVPYRTLWCRTVKYRTVPYRAVMYRTVKYRTVPYGTVHYRPLTRKRSSTPPNRGVGCVGYAEVFACAPDKNIIGHAASVTCSYRGTKEAPSSLYRTSASPGAQTAVSSSVRQHPSTRFCSYNSSPKVWAVE